MRKYFKPALGVFLGVLFGAGAISGQVTGGAVTGSVVDAAGAVIPNAQVRLADKLRGQVLTAQTTDAGSYLFPNVPVGEYTLTVERSGFADAARELTVALNQTTTVDVALQPAGATSTVDVVAASEAIVQTDSSQLGKSFDRRKVEDLPIAGNPNNLALLAPNVAPRATGTQGSGAAIGGVRPRGNSFNIDGVDNNDPGITGPSTAVIQDAVEEFTLLQNNFNAEFGSGAGGQFNTITKSGTNDFRGSLFTYVNSQRFNARSTLEDGGDKNFLKGVRYGGTFGGPLPFFNFGEGGPVFASGKNKLFFFGAFERDYAAGEGSSTSYIAPTLAGLNQIAALPNASPFVVDIFRNNVTLASAPNTTRTVLGVSGIPFGTVILPIPASAETKNYQFNIDHLPNEKNQFRYRFSSGLASAEQPGNGGLAFNNLFTNDTKLFSANWIRTFSSSVINDFRVSYRRDIQDFPLKESAVTNFPNLTIESLNLLIGPNRNLPQGSFDNSYQAYDALTLVGGQHTFKFGGEFRKGITSSVFLPRQRGEYFYSSLDVLLQDLIPDSQNIRGVGSGNFTTNNYRVFAFGQDDWKIRPNLTLNLGVRYEYQSLPRDAATQALNSVADVPGVIEFTEPKTDKNNFAPRVGFAWSPDWDNRLGRLLFGERGESSIRANFARAHFVNFTNLLILNLPPQFSSELQNSGSATQFLQNGGANNTFTPITNPALARAFTASYIVDQTVPFTDSISVSYQRQLGSNTGLELRYLSTRGKKLPVQLQYNAGRVVESALVIPTFLSAPTASQVSNLPTRASILASNPTIGVRPLAQYGFFGVVTAFEPIGKSWYDGVSASVTRRFTKGFGLTAAYTFSKTLDNSTNELNSSALNPRRPENAGNIIDGLNIDAEKSISALDIPHRFVTSFNYDVPFFNNSENAFLRAALGGFQINGIFQIQSGQPITIRSGIDSNLNGDSAGDRAIFNPDGDPNVGSGIYAVNAAGQRIRLETAPGVFVDVLNSPNTVAYVALNPNAGFIQTGFLARSTAGRNSFRTQGFNVTDIVVLKNTRFGADGRFNLQIGAEIFDLFNQRPRTLVGVGAQTGAFGLPNSPSFLDYGIGDFSGRTITLRAKFIF